jgi:hypothetical protein
VDLAVCRISGSDGRKAALRRILIMDDKGRYQSHRWLIELIDVAAFSGSGRVSPVSDSQFQAFLH